MLVKLVTVVFISVLVLLYRQYLVSVFVLLYQQYLASVFVLLYQLATADEAGAGISVSICAFIQRHYLCFYLASVFVLLYQIMSAGEAGAGRTMLLRENSATVSQVSGRSDHLRQYLYF